MKKFFYMIILYFLILYFKYNKNGFKLELEK